MSRTNPRYHRISPPATPLTNADGVVRYTIKGTCQNQLTINSFDFHGPVNNPTTTQLSTLLQNISTAVFPLYKACLASDWTCSLELLQVMHRNDINSVGAVVNAGAVGSIAGATFDTELACVIDKQTALKGQHGRGRCSLPAVPTSQITGSMVTGVTLQAALSAFCTPWPYTKSDGTNNWTACVSQRGLTPPKLITAYTLVAQFKFVLLLGTIRRRKIGRGK
jgi:hypothetical protein